MPTADALKPFNLLRWFAWLSPIVIALTALANAWQISSFLNNHLFQREAEISRDFVQNVLVADGSVEYLASPKDATLSALFHNTVEHFSHMPDVLRANVFSKNRSILWSTDKALVGRSFDDNDELDDALKGELVVNAGEITPEARQKSEHVGLDPTVQFFVETYIPVVNPVTHQIVGVVELYKAPRALTQAIREGRTQVVLGALASALVLYLTLFWMVRRADNTIKQQHAQLMENQTLAVMGELASAVAHNIRNPLASIRSAAELSLESPGEDCTEQTRDIIREVDRISARINDLLQLSGKHPLRAQAVDLAALLQQCVSEYAGAFSSRAQTLTLGPVGTPCVVAADPVLLQQALHSILSNAMEAMTAGGQCRIELRRLALDTARIEISDSGAGIAAQDMAQVFRPFFTTKPQGLGLGLPLARRIVDRFGGTLAVHNQTRGTRVTIDLPMT